MQLWLTHRSNWTYRICFGPNSIFSVCHCVSQILVMGARFLLWAGGGCDVLEGDLADPQGCTVAALCVDLCAEQPLEGDAKPHHHATRVRPCFRLGKNIPDPG